MASNTTLSSDNLQVRASVQITDLPQEIVNLIVDLVAEISPNKRAAFHVCNIVSRSFHARAQQKLFESIEFVVDSNTSNRAHRLRRVLEAKPRLVHIIHSFKVIIQEPRYLMEVLQPLKKRMFFNKRSSSKGSLMQELGTLGSKEHLIWLLETISSVQVVNFSLVVPEGNNVNWSSLSENSQSLFLSIRSSLRLKTLELANISSLSNRMIIGPDLQNTIVRQDSLPIQNLTIRRCRLETSSTVVFDIPFISVPFRHLKTFDLTEESPNFLNELQSTIDTDSNSASRHLQFPSLTKLAASIDCQSVKSSKSVQNLLNSCRRTVKSIKLNVSNPEGDPLTTKFILPRLRALQELCVSVKARNTDITHPYLRFVTRLLRSSSGSSSLSTSLLQNLETLELSLGLEAGNGREVQAAFGWEDLDKAIVVHKNLRKVIIRLKVEQLQYYGSDHRPSSCKIIDAKNVLPLTYLDGRIDIEIKNTALTDLNF